MQNRDDKRTIERIRAGFATEQERDAAYRIEHGLMTEQERADLRAEVEAFIDRNRWYIRRRTLEAWLWGAEPNMPPAWFYGRWVLYASVATALLIWFSRQSP